MADDLIEKAYGTLLPITNELTLDPAILSFLDRGGKAVLFGEYGDEFVAGRMRAERVAKETREEWCALLAGLRRRSGPLLFACDTDISAVNRLHHIAGELPSSEDAISQSIGDLTASIEVFAGRVRSLGMNMVLSPTADYVSAGNPWLGGRTVASELDDVARIVSAFVTGARRAGLQTALKHFPGNDQISGHPARERAFVPLEFSALLAKAAPFMAGIDAGAEAVVLSSAVYEAATPPASASLSADIVEFLRRDFGFTGLVITLDLDHVSAQGSKTIEETCVSALTAGADLLLLSPDSVSRIPSIISAIVHAVQVGKLPYERLRRACEAVLRQVR
ncbi:glycoside hydrolase family 3 N-terminal domain-containing protein [Rhizobium sp. RCAM05973]|uniref:glycoside hydrolase family 3 N-terminal domain-containing protein n=1 Tax=Rhizobium sp. RCAM05973 TaxID=2994066 RepID=UPI0022EBF2D1|nr:glycoside hydrolase family 3 N-terminal domain-containing protein [Rhizobium sp. RCAM05973]